MPLDETTASGTTRRLSFSVQGEFITDLAREKLYCEHDLKYAMDLILSSTTTDQLSEAEHLLLAVDILEGRKKLAGVYPGPDYGVYDDEPTGKTPGIAAAFDQLKKTNAELRHLNTELTDKIIFLGEAIEPYQRKNLAREWDRTSSRFDERSSLFPVQEDDEDGPDMSPLVADYLAAATSEKPEEYGWLAPSGDFHPVEWGEHQAWARDYLSKHPELLGTDADKRSALTLADPGDRLAARGWILLHSPHMGIARPTGDPARPATKAQREFLYGYYSDRGHPDLAEQYFHEDT